MELPTLPRGVYRAPCLSMTGLPLYVAVRSDGALAGWGVVPRPQLRDGIVADLWRELNRQDPVGRAA